MIVRQIFLFVFWVGEEKIDFIVLYEVVNDPDSTALSSSLCRPANLPQTTAASYDVPRFRIEGESNLKASVIAFLQEKVNLLGKDRRFDEMHMFLHTPLA